MSGDEDRDQEADGAGPEGGDESIDRAIDRLAAAWPTPELTDEQRQIYRDVLADVAPEHVDQAVERLLREGREERPPPGLVRDRARKAAEGRGVGRWLPAAVLAVAVAAAIVSIALAVRGGDDEPAAGLPDPERIAAQLSDWDWQAGLETQSVNCERISEERAECDVLFTTGDMQRVAVLPGDAAGELVVDVAEPEGTTTQGTTTEGSGTTP